MIVFLPYRAEFGFICMVHAPQVHAHADAGVERMVCIEPGVDALYPGCQFHYVERRLDEDRRARPEIDVIERTRRAIEDLYGKDHEFISPDGEAPRRYFIPQPVGGQDALDKSACDVVVCPRKRKYGPDKNWQHWPDLTEMLQGRGLSVLACGAPDSSEDVPCPKAWDHPDFLDCTIAAMLNAKVVVASDAGLAHLAVMCGRPLVMISHGMGFVAPGQDDVGNDYWPIHLDRYERENHTGSLIRVVHHAWYDPKTTLDAVLDTLNLAADAAQNQPCT